MRISDWSSDVCSSDLGMGKQPAVQRRRRVRRGGMTRLPEALKDIVARRFRQQQNTGEVPGRAKPCRFRSKVLEGAVEQPRQLEAVVDMNMSIHRSEERRGGNECDSTCRSRCAP